MTHINLLPWRARRRRERRRRFLLLLAASLTTGILILAWTGRNLSRAESAQQARNVYLRNQIAVLDGRIAAVRALRGKRDALLDRIAIVERLERNRPLVVHLFDQLPRTLPDGLYLTAVSENDDSRLRISGVVQSPAAVSAYLRKLAHSRWFGAANLEVVRAHVGGGGMSNDFSITAGLVWPRPAGDMKEDNP